MVIIFRTSTQSDSNSHVQLIDRFWDTEYDYAIEAQDQIPVNSMKVPCIGHTVNFLWT